MRFVHAKEITSNGYNFSYEYLSLPSSQQPGTNTTTTYSCNGGTFSEYLSGTSAVSYTADYQPEDRYGMVDKTGNTDTNNFITINTQLSDPYILFYNNVSGTGTPMFNGSKTSGTGDATTTGIKLAALDTDSDTSNTSYKIRLPKYAKSFKIKNGATGTESAPQALEGAVKVTSASDGTYNTSGAYTISNFRHAGTTFNVSVDSTPVISITSLRSGYTVTKQPNMTDPLNPKTDADYVFFTDVDNMIGGSSTVYAYFYGDVDGEYKAWPGIAAVAPNVNTTADTSYTDNDNQTVYAFRIPKDLDGKYKYVIFNNGTTDTHKATEAQRFTGGKNYVLNTTPSTTYQYGSFVANGSVYPVTEADKATADTTTVYSTAGTSNYIYIINNGTQDLTGNNTITPTDRYVLDEMHVVFYDASKAVIGNAAPGYKPDKISDTNVYKIQVPSNAQYFQINNGANKSGSTTNSHVNDRQSEIKVINANGLYKFVDSEYLTSIGKGNTAENYIEGGNVPSTVADRYQPNYLLGLTNVIKTDDNKPVSETIDIHLATVVTGIDGKIDHIKWLKDSTTSIDHEYLANENADGKVVKVKKQGDYYWKETIAPSGYQVNPDQIPVSNGTATVTDPENPKGSLTFSKNLKKPSDTAHTTTSTDTFTFTVVLTAPVGTNWTSFVTTPTFSSTATGATLVSTTDDGLTRTIKVKLPADSTSVTIGNIPSGTTYYVTETAENTDNYSSTPVSISETKYTGTTPNPETKSVTSMEGTIPDYTTAQSTNNNVSYAVTNKRKVGSLTLGKTVSGTEDALSHAGVNQNGEHTSFTFKVTLTAPSGVDFRDYISYTTLTGLGATVTSHADAATYNNAAVSSITLTIPVKANNGTKTINNLPYGTTYTVVEDDPTNTYKPTKPNVTWSKSGEIESTVSEANRTIDSAHPAPSVTINNNYSYQETPGSLTLKKELQNAPFNVTNNTVFKFNVTLTKGSGNITVNVNGTPKTIISGTAFTEDVTVNSPVKITNIPIDTTYKVTEADSEPAPSSKSGEVTTETALTGNEPIKTVTITNTYTEVPKTITLFKQDAESHAGIPGAEFYLLKLRDTTDINDTAVKEAFANGTITSVTNSTTGYADVVTGITDADSNNVLKTSAEGMITVSGITINTGDRYFFFEAAAGITILEGPVVVNYKKDNTLTPAKVITINNAQDEYVVTYDNDRVPPSTDVDVKKTDTTGNPLGGAIFDLFFKEVIIPKTYTYNDPFNTPSPIETTEVGSGPEVPAEDRNVRVTPPTYTYTYTDKSVPSASDKDWILPRTDNDYIYFRDYNVNVGTVGMEDKQSFNDGAQDSVPQNDKRSWLYTRLKNNVQGQAKEIDYTHNYWFAAQFSGAGKQTVQYSVWERFVDRYTDPSSRTSDTVVWKIQPPDGYTKVRFLMYDNDQCVRTTEEFSFKLGTIYHKTSWGGMYKEENGKKCYFNVPVEGEKYWSTYYNGTVATPDKRQNYSTITDKLSNVGNTTAAPKQADRYTPTEQKIVFHCNSTVVWHNIHIEFFTDATSGEIGAFEQGGKYYKPVGQSFPGYLMEPYAYAGSDYRINGYLTYELTIPNEAKYFRVNNGVDGSSEYNFRSNITPFKHIEGRKNYGNYFKIIDADRGMNRQPITLTEWTSYTSTGDKWTESYSTLDVDSDYDYVYFEAPSSWGTHIYAYFYGGGDLRKDNWQRATYSVWPGVAAVATEYEEKGSAGTTTYHSDTYGYSYTGLLYDNSAKNASPTNPESTFQKDGKTIYKFRIPKGDRTNYSKVIFNNGLSTQVSGGDNKLHETGVITYKAGFIYQPNGTFSQHYDSSPTYSYTKRGTGDDYIYVRVANTDNTWDDLHITFYNGSGQQILQSGVGYIMEYSGKMADGGITYKYYRAAIPTNAAKFSVNNGRDKGGSIKSTGQYEILPLGTMNTTSTGYTTDRMVFTLNGTTLACISPDIQMERQEGTTSITEQDSRRDYTVRQSNSTNDVLYIRDVANWDIAFADGKIKFYDGNGQLITGDGTKGNGEYTLIKTVAETGADGKVWYYIEIPSNAKSFNIFYYKNSTAYTSPNYDIYPYGAEDTEGNHTTTGNMYYETETDGRTLKLLDMTVGTEQVVTKAEYTAPSYVSSGTRDGKGGDDLYLVCGDRTQWKNMTVTFYKADGTAMTFTQGSATDTDAIVPEYLNQVVYEPINPVSGESTSDENAVGYWYKVAIPKDAVTFTVTGTNTTSTAHTTAKAEIYKLKDTPTRFEEGWTLGDMQYRLPDSGTTPTLLYPVFTEVDVQTMEAGGETVYDYVSSNKADETAVADYAGADAALLPTHNITEPAYPVLYETSDSKVTYEWGTPGSYIYFNNSNTGWTSVKAYFHTGTYTDTTGETVTSYTTWNSDSEAMESVGSNIYRIAVPTEYNSRPVSFSKVIFHNGSGAQTQDGNVTVGYLYTPNLKSGNYLYVYTSVGDNPNIHARFNDSSDDIAGDNADGQISDVGPTIRRWDLTNNYSSFRVRLVDGGHNYSSETSFKGNGYGEVWEATENYNTAQLTFRGYVNSSNQVVTSSDGKIPLKTPTAYSGAGGGGTVSVTYQPEDRYSMISEANSTSTPVTTGETDINDFIYITTSIDDPHIYFYTSDDGTGTEIGTFTPSGTTDGISLAYTKVNSNDVTAQSGTYKIRLPRNAKSFKITNGTVTSAVQKLYENVTVSAETHQISGTGDQITLTNFHHAGTTFQVANNGTISIGSLRSGYTVSKGGMTDPLNPRTDADYIFFTDTGSFADSGKVYAYYYGGVDGEYTAWPGIAAAQDSAAPTTYTDNNGKTVYLFRVPQSADGKVQIPASGNAEVTVNTANNEAFARQDSSACLLNAYFIYLDGSERAMTAEEKANLVFSFTTQDEGETFDNDFSFNANMHKITVANPSNYKNRVYKLNAKYGDKFLSEVNIAFGDGATTPVTP